MLGKWPTMVVSGDPLTREQTNEVLLRTSHRRYWNLTNDRAWEKDINDIVGIEVAEHRTGFEERLAVLARNESRYDELGFLHLSYTHNSQIASAYIFGPHGWLNWDGVITGNMPYNVGKHPDEEELLEDWTQIAKAFPYLNLTVQFFAERTLDESESEKEVLLEIQVQNGEAVSVETPSASLLVDFPPFSLDGMTDNLRSAYRERGVSAERLIEAVKQVEGS